MELHNVAVITKIKKKTNSKVFKNTKVGDEIYIAMMLEDKTNGYNSSPKHLLYVFNRRTNESDYKHINLVTKILEENFEFYGGRI